MGVVPFTQESIPHIENWCVMLFASLAFTVFARPRKPLACGLELEQRRMLGQTIRRTFELMGLAPKAVAERLGLEDASQLSRWFSGESAPPMARLMGLSGFNAAFVIALAELDGSAFEVRRVVTVVERRTA